MRSMDVPTEANAFCQSQNQINPIVGSKLRTSRALKPIAYGCNAIVQAMQLCLKIQDSALSGQCCQACTSSSLSISGFPRDGLHFRMECIAWAMPVHSTPSRRKRDAKRMDKQVLQQYEDKYTEFTLGCDEGLVDSCHALGEWWAFMRQDWGKARELYEFACEKHGHKNSCFNLAAMYGEESAR